jgi:hypothetical protein
MRSLIKIKTKICSNNPGSFLSGAIMTMSIFSLGWPSFPRLDNTNRVGSICVTLAKEAKLISYNYLDWMQIFALKKQSLILILISSLTSRTFVALHPFKNKILDLPNTKAYCLVFLIAFVSNFLVLLIVNSCSVCVFVKIISSNKLDLLWTKSVLPL